MRQVVGSVWEVFGVGSDVFFGRLEYYFFYVG